MSDKVSVITILHGEKEFVPLILNNFNNFINRDNLELVVIDDGKDNLAKLFCDIDDCTYIHLTIDEINQFMKQIEEEYKLPNKSDLFYHKLIKNLPNGFKRDYGCGLSTHDYIFHMNADCIYNKRAVDRKLRFMKRVGAECIYCDTTLCYDIYGKQLYKTQSHVKIYESTLFHNREFWKRKGFKWSDTVYEGKQFHYNNGIDRKMDNFYDTIQLLSIHNMNMYNPIKIELENMDIKIPEIVCEIEITEHPFVKYIDDIFENEVDILGIGSEFLMNVKKEGWNPYNITEKWKQPKLASLVKNIKSEFNVLIYNSKYPAWDLFNHVPFDIIMLETQKNYEQMISIIDSCKKYNYIQIKGIFVREDILNK
jgi:hypothetical protein